MEREGIASGGPMDGIKLTANVNWNGRVEKDLNGRYCWDYVNERWAWTILDQAFTPRTGRPHKTDARRKL